MGLQFEPQRGLRGGTPQTEVNPCTAVTQSEPAVALTVTVDTVFVL